ncbi:3-deoxy-D-manno-octulosonic acid kinase [Bowmanella sp. JS7-9]|uniref:3-deoxy-D-manno-octulosonic acid kinase n=1 Tax=Pseudobowmanella zhangzhouensis TaxID=1537679 RepID=A0ABW1XPQ4_9ALTE|nr:3-deoxy-D-manno-octulosonic acid kinase [Bowmanella sp. JS7-9]TBX20682.1 hypothetical protein TK45_14415 [Bowmanella sp. JS7-9]
MALIEQKISAQQNLFATAEFIGQVTPGWFDVNFWQQQQAITGQAKGRGAAIFIQHQQHQWVLRHYRRGGLVGKFIRDAFWFTGQNRTRVARELNLLAQMREWHLPCPSPVAGRVIQSGLLYRNDILIERIADATDVHDILCKRALTDDQWQSIGRTIRRFHDKQVYHHDLNIHNILLDASDEVWLIDFDKCDIRIGERWKQDNLARLHRSLQKELGKKLGYHFSQSDWLALISGYQP